MTEQDWRRVALVLGVAVVVLIGVAGAMAFAGGSERSAPSPSPSIPIAQVSGSPAASTSPVASASPSVSQAPSAAPSASPSPSSSPSPSPSPAVPAAVVRIANLQLDDPAATDATARQFVVTTDGAGSMTAKLVSASGGKAKFCLQAGTSKAWCGNYGGGVVLTGTTSIKGKTRFTVTLIGASKGSAPTVTVDINFFAKAPTLEFSGVRIDPTRGPTGLDTRLTTRSQGSVELQADLLDTTTSSPALNAPWRVRMVALSGPTFPPQDLLDTGATAQMSGDVGGAGTVQVTLGAQQGTSPSLLASGSITWP